MPRSRTLHPSSSTAETNLLKVARSWLRFLVDEDQAETEAIRQLHAACLPACGRRLGITRRGLFCLVPGNTIPGDRIYIPKLSKVPFVFRCQSLDAYYENVGECYLQGAMCGESAEWDGIRPVQIKLR